MIFFMFQFYQFHVYRKERDNGKIYCNGSLLKERYQLIFFCRYFKTDSGDRKDDIYKWWHTQLANYFETTKRFMRKIEVFESTFNFTYQTN